jgi:hypothetical protein
MGFSLLTLSHCALLSLSHTLMFILSSIHKTQKFLVLFTPSTKEIILTTFLLSPFSSSTNIFQGSSQNKCPTPGDYL